MAGLTRFAGPLAGLAAAFLVMQQITTGAFDSLEAREAAQDAQRLRIGLDGQAEVLQVLGATNAVSPHSPDAGHVPRASYGQLSTAR
ncbi:hypothetical protein [Dactylosporangium sp. NPDC000521]|uniref:hypothetical protein n=1 Tax=Dactylosporangium sp. NPDC000521 TaxID=3363975 RepID=UPI0036A08862